LRDTRLMTRGDEMEDAQLGAFAAQFIAALSLSIGWLIICRILRSVRIRIRITLAYLIAAGFALLGPALTASGPALSGFAASMLVLALLYSRWKLSLKKQSLNAGTIVGFELT
jgi:hypothetical protein